jgi:hypothetical protein
MTSKESLPGISSARWVIIAFCPARRVGSAS